ncbi:MAG: N-acetylmuramoyl-L-alanine amidase [Planctomycetota bacterium]|jgi:N-acetylmuramoyl-L-alanine amidase
MVRIKHIIFFFGIFAVFIIFFSNLSLSTNQSNDNKLSFEYPATINQLRYWSNISYTRIVIDLNNEVPFNFKLTKIETPAEASSRLSIDIQNSKLSKKVKRIVQINDDLVIDARLDQFTSSSVRVLIDIKKLIDYKIFSLSNSFRIVVDFRGKSTESSDLATERAITKDRLLKRLPRPVKRICIDPGFGGRAKGASGCKNGIFSKDINLEIAKMLANKIRETLNIEIIMTREADQYVTLEERTAIANTKNADLFISIHTNANKDRRIYGITTYYLNLATDDDSIRVAAMENATSTKNIADLQTILYSLLQSSKMEESKRLSKSIQTAVASHMTERYQKIKDLGTQPSPFYVLLGTQMPAVLIATSFISNPRECKRLLSEKYQNDLCEGIVSGIQNYIKETKFIEK